MIKNYLITALRYLKRNPVHSILNISGMAIGMASALLLILWVSDEWSYDRHFENADNLYRVIEKQKLTGGGISMLAVAPGPLGKALKEEYPEIIRSSRYTLSPLTLKKGDEFVEETVASVDKDFLKMFGVRFIEGDKSSALNDPHNIVFTEEMAHKYFGNENALGKTIESRGFRVTITGIVKSFPHNSHIRFNFLVPIEWLKEFGAPIGEWQTRDLTYVELSKGTDSKVVDNKIRGFIGKHCKESNSEIFLQNIKDIHLFSSRKYIYDVSGNGDILYVRIMGIIAFFILSIACINFTNLFTAQSSGRAKEIGIRKAAGAGKRTIVIQFLGESLLIVFIAHIIAMILVELLLPGFNNLTGKHLVVNYQSTGLYLGLLILLLFCGLSAGSYPAFYLSSLKPLETIKGDNNIKPGNTKFRSYLVVLQFSLSLLLIICTMIVYGQLGYIQNKDLGFNKDNLCYFMFPIRPGDPKLKALKKEISNCPDIVSVTIARPNPFNNEYSSGGFNWRGKKPGEDIMFHFIGADEDYAKTFQLELKKGRFFSAGYTTDASTVVINETASRAMGLKDPIGETITTPEGFKLSIIGVVRDFHFQSLHYMIEPLIMKMSDDNNLILRAKPDKTKSIVVSVDKIFKSFNPGLPLDFHFLDDDFDNLYRAEKRSGKIVACFSILAVIISCLGLLGLSSHLTKRRTKETGIRKVNGGTSIEVFSMLSREYIVLIIISLLIATPIAWYVMNKWLQNFAYRINITFWVFVLAGIAIIAVTILTVGLQSYNAAHKNPVDALRYE